eukprot:5589285-Prymnesium_polylepis.1
MDGYNGGRGGASGGSGGVGGSGGTAGGGGAAGSPGGLTSKTHVSADVAAALTPGPIAALIPAPARHSPS